MSEYGHIADQIRAVRVKLAALLCVPTSELNQLSDGIVRLQAFEQLAHGLLAEWSQLEEQALQIRE